MLSHSDVSNSLWPHRLQHAKLPCPISQFFASGGQRIGVSASASVFPMNIQDWFPLQPTGWMSLQSKGLSRVFSNTTGQKHQFFSTVFFLVQLSHPYMTTGKTIALTRGTFFAKIMSLLFNVLSRLAIAFFPRSKHLLISWLQSPSAVILEPPKNKVSQCFHCFPIYLPWSDGITIILSSMNFLLKTKLGEKVISSKLKKY